MKILLSPSETKQEGGHLAAFCKTNFFLKDQFEVRQTIFEQYNQFLKKTDAETLSSWFGLKKTDEALKLKNGISSFPSMKAIERYTGVAFSALGYEQLSAEAQQYIDENLLLFSNLFGAIKAGDLIPDYKLKQGAKLDGLNIESYYKKQLSEALDAYIGDEVLDLRAGFHEKQYKPKQAKVVKIKFIKNGKVVSHWSKHYRGLVCKHIASNQVTSLEDFFKLKIKTLEISNSTTKGNVEEVEMQIID